MRSLLAPVFCAVLLLTGCTVQEPVSDDFPPCSGPPQSCQPNWAKWQTPNDPDPAYHFIDSSGYLHLPSVYWQGGGQFGWDDGHIRTLNTFRPPFFVAARAKVEAGYGTWSSPLWMWPKAGVGGCVEIDVTEQLGRQPQSVNQSIHNYCRDRVVTLTPNCGITLANDFHVYWAYVGLDRVDFHVDQIDSCARTIRAADVGLGTLDQDYQFVTSTHTGGCCTGWTGVPDPSLSPVEMLIDWFRVYDLG
jgi:hypothetical protein